MTVQVNNNVAGPALDSAAVAAAMGFSFDAQGNLIANVVPRTGNLSTLLGYAGGVGELASATDSPAVVQYTGTVGGAKAFHTFGATYSKTFDGSYSGTQTLPSWAMRSSLTIDNTNPVTITLDVSAGYYVGQLMTVDVLKTVSGASAITLTLGANLLHTDNWLVGYAYSLRWNGTKWTVLDFTAVGAGIAGAYAQFGARSFAIGVAIGPGASVNTDNQLSISGGMALNPANLNETAIAGGSFTYNMYSDIYATSSAASTAYELTLDGLSANSGNRFAMLPGEGGVCRLSITLQGRLSASQTDVWSNTYDMCVAVSSLGQLALVGAVAAGTAISGGGTIGTPTVAITVASNRVKIIVTTSATNTSSTKWVAGIRTVKQVMP